MHLHCCARLGAGIAHTTLVISRKQYFFSPVSNTRDVPGRTFISNNIKRTNSMSAERCLVNSSITILQWPQQQPGSNNTNYAEPVSSRQVTSQELHADTLRDTHWFCQDSSVCVM